MANETKVAFLEELTKRYGKLHKLGTSLSLYELGTGAARIYIRYSKVHRKGITFYGLRKEDLQQLEGYSSVICFIWEGQIEPLFVPYSEYEDVFRSVSPASDGQYKVQVIIQDEGVDLYIANAGKFKAESYFGWQQLNFLIETSKLTNLPELSHSHVQTLLGSIGSIKGYDIWVPQSDRGKLDWSITSQFECADSIPDQLKPIEKILSEIDVIWIKYGTGKLRALFEVEHSTPIYSGLLRLNDVYLTVPDVNVTYNIVSNDDRRSLFVSQLNRPTFKASSFNKSCTFMEYLNVFVWHKHINALKGGCHG